MATALSTTHALQDVKLLNLVTDRNRPLGVPHGAAVQKTTEPKCLLAHIAKARVVAKIKSEALTSQVVLYLSLRPSHIFKCRY